jgi:hypothetical protein
MSFFVWYLIIERMVGPRTAARLVLLGVLMVIGMFFIMITSAGQVPRY